MFVLTVCSVPNEVAAIPFHGSEIVIAAPSPYAVEVGQELADKGGNVVDVAVSVALTLSVTSPYFASLGGGGLALVKIGNDVQALDFRETAPLATHRDFFPKDDKNASILGGKAIGVPGIPAGLWELHHKYGKLPWSSLFREPYRLAVKGFRVSGEWLSNTNRMKDSFDQKGKTLFFKKDGQSFRPGEKLYQPKLGKALEYMRDRGMKGFYQGPVASDIVDTIKKRGGVISTDDLAQYKVRWLKPISTDFKSYKIHLMPPPSSGGVVIKTALGLVDRLPIEKQPPLSANEFHLLGETLSRAFKGRALLGDPDFAKNPLDRLLSSRRWDQLAKSIRLDRSVDIGEKDDEDLLKGTESKETTHFTVMDAKGNTVSMTVTLNGHYGSGVVTDDYGIAMNNEMDDFTTRPDQPNLYGLVQGKANEVGAGKRPLSSMSPTIVETNKGETYMALGAPGGPRIISAVFQVLYRVLVREMDMDQAIQTPRVHHQFRPHRLFVDGQSVSPEILEDLRNKNHAVEEVTNVARVCGIRRLKDPTTQQIILEGAFDHRGEGAVGGH